jgi:hypothetical protein
MKTTRLFRNLWRVNAVIIFAAGVLTVVVILVSGYYMLKAATREREVDGIVNTDTGQRVKQSVALGNAREIHGHPWMLVPLESDQEYDGAYFSKSSSAARNYAFVSQAVEMRWLYPHSRFLIVDATQLSGSDCSSDSNVTSLISFEVVQQDTDGDKRLTPDDSSALVFTRPDGTGTTMVLENINGVTSQEVMGEELLVIYEDRDGYAAATFSLKDFSAVKRERFVLPPMGS